MLYSLQTNDVTKYPGDINDVADFIASLSPDQLPIIQALADTVTLQTEKLLGQPLGKRSCRFVISRGESEVNDAYLRSWLTPSSSFYNNTINQWINLPCKIESVQGVWITSWTSEELIPVDYKIDLFSYKPRITFTLNDLIQDIFNHYNNLIIDFTGGLYEVDGSIPSSVDTAIKLQTKALYENRGDSTVDLKNNGYDYLLAPYKNPEIAGGR